MKPIKKQNGIALVVALIALLAISLAAVSLIRTVDTTNVVSGNFSFNEAAVQMEEIGADQAYNWIQNNIACWSGASTCTSTNYYYSDALAVDATTKLPAGTLNWTTTGIAGVPSGYAVQYIIERMCGTSVGGVASGVAVPAFANCYSSPIYPIASPGAYNGNLYFRVTVQVIGPRNSAAFGQYFFAQPANL